MVSTETNLFSRTETVVLRRLAGLATIHRLSSHQWKKAFQSLAIFPRVDAPCSSAS